jgi:hypothetical protein
MPIHLPEIQSGASREEGETRQRSDCADAPGEKREESEHGLSEAMVLGNAGTKKHSRVGEAFCISSHNAEFCARRAVDPVGRGFY